MNKTDRLLALVLELQAHGKRRAQDLAATFEVGIRTIYRDIQALSEAGVPVVAVPGQGYSLIDGYFLPPLHFSPDEAIILLLGSDVMQQSFDREYREAAQSAGRKIAGALPDRLRNEVRSLQESIQFLGANAYGPGPPSELLATVRRAIVGRRQVSFVYHSKQRANVQAQGQSRTADPYALINISGAWYMVAYCHTRQAVRSFRLGRIETLNATGANFTRPEGFRPSQSQVDDRTLTVRVLFSSEVARWVEEARNFYTVKSERTPGGLVLTLRVRQLEDLTQWLLSWGRNARVLEPPEMRQLLARELEAALAIYSEQ